jgi:hypothetical protein
MVENVNIRDLNKVKGDKSAVLSVKETNLLIVLLKIIFNNRARLLKILVKMIKVFVNKILPACPL